MKSTVQGLYLTCRRSRKFSAMCSRRRGHEAAAVAGEPADPCEGSSALLLGGVPQEQNPLPLHQPGPQKQQQRFRVHLSFALRKSECNSAQQQKKHEEDPCKSTPGQAGSQAGRTPAVGIPEVHRMYTLL